MKYTKWYLLTIGLYLCITDVVIYFSDYNYPLEPNNRFILGTLLLLGALIIAINKKEPE